MGDELAIRDRPDKTPDHIVREKLLGMQVVDVIHFLDVGGTPPRDTLYLVAPDGSAVEIEAERLYLDFIPDYEAQLAAIKIDTGGG